MNIYIYIHILKMVSGERSSNLYYNELHCYTHIYMLTPVPLSQTIIFLPLLSILSNKSRICFATLHFLYSNYIYITHSVKWLILTVYRALPAWQYAERKCDYYRLKFGDKFKQQCNSTSIWNLSSSRWDCDSIDTKFLSYHETIHRF